MGKPFYYDIIYYPFIYCVVLSPCFFAVWLRSILTYFTFGPHREISGASPSSAVGTNEKLQTPNVPSVEQQQFFQHKDYTKHEFDKKMKLKKKTNT